MRSTILTVCTANICRSPVMELLLRDRLDPTMFEIASAGLRGWNRAPVDSMVRLELARLGVDSAGFRSRHVESVKLSDADLILTATRQHRSELLELEPSSLRRTFTLVEFAALAAESDATDLKGLAADASRRRSTGPADADVSDPYGRPPEVHRRVVDLIDRSTAQITTVLRGLRPRPDPRRRTTA